MSRTFRIAQVAPPLERVPPRAYGGTERIVHELVQELTARGHEVTTFASADSEVPGRLIPTVEKALRPAGYGGDTAPWFYRTIQAVLDHGGEFDVVHAHVDAANFLLARVSDVPVVSTFHGRLDTPWAQAAFVRPTPGLVAISANQASSRPEARWAAIIHNGLTLDASPFGRNRGDSLCFVGRVTPEKGIVEAIEIAQLSGRRLRIAAKAGALGGELAYLHDVFLPAVKAAGSSVEYLGELEQADRDQLFAESYATLMPGTWPEPFGLVAIESLACGTPVIAQPVGALPEIVRDGIDGFFGSRAEELAAAVDRVGGLDRVAIRGSVLERFSAERMTGRYEAVYRRMLGEHAAEVPDGARPYSRRTGLQPVDV